MQLEAWAARWGVSHAALTDLRDGLLGLDYAGVQPLTGSSEAAVQASTRLAAARVGARLWRNNVGAYQHPDTGQFVRYGLCNESAAVNKRVKSSDLIGIRPVRIGPEHVGRVLGQFVAREVKSGSWRFAGSERETAQLAFLALVLSLGGDAKFVKAVDSF